MLSELGLGARLTVYLASAPGAGKTRRLLEEARAHKQSGIDVAIGWIDLKGRSDLQALTEGLRVIPPRKVRQDDTTVEEFDLQAAIAAKPSTIILDELAHTNAGESRNANRWQDALSLRDAGISVIGALDVHHLDTVAPAAQRAIGSPIGDIVPFSFLQKADQVVVLDAPPDLIEARLRSGAIVPKDDIERALATSVKSETFQTLRELMLRTLDELTTPVLRPTKVSTVLAIVDGKGDPSIFLRKCAAFADATDLALHVTTLEPASQSEVERIVRTINAHLIPPLPASRGRPDWSAAAATVMAVPAGELARTLASSANDRHLFIVDPATLRMTEPEVSARHPYAQTAGDRLRIGYGRFTIYLGAATGSGKTRAILDRAKQMQAQGVDVVAALVEARGDPETEAMVEGLERLERKNGELDREALMKRRPEVALIDDLAHANSPGSEYPNRYLEVLSLVRAGISVITTLNVQNLEGLSDAILRITGRREKETLPDGILELADEVILVDATPEVIEARLRVRQERQSSPLSRDSLTALRELAIRETMHARSATRFPAPFSHIVVGVRDRERDIALIEWGGRLASRLDVEITVVHVAPSHEALKAPVFTKLRTATHAARATWHEEVSPTPAAALVGFAQRTSRAAIAVEGARRRALFWQRPSFGRQLLDCGATELFVFSPMPFEPAT